MQIATTTSSSAWCHSNTFSVRLWLTIQAPWVGFGRETIFCTKRKYLGRSSCSEEHIITRYVKVNFTARRTPTWARKTQNHCDNSGKVWRKSAAHDPFTTLSFGVSSAPPTHLREPSSHLFPIECEDVNELLPLSRLLKPFASPARLVKAKPEPPNIHSAARKASVTLLRIQQSIWHSVSATMTNTRCTFPEENHY